MTTEELNKLWLKVKEEWFPDLDELNTYRVTWSNRRQKRTLASCNIKLKRVTVAMELNHDNVSQWLEPILYHEMCHAVVKYRNSSSGRRLWHDRKFRELEAQHPQIPALNAWIKAGGWSKAVRSSRSRDFWQKLKTLNIRKLDISSSI